MLTWLMCFLAFAFDKDRIPLALPVLLAASLCGLIPNQHRYPTENWTSGLPRDASIALDQRRIYQQEKNSADGRPLVAIAASGGGIRASYWTTHVLERLASDIPGFEHDIALISSVSGGSVGHMYYLDRQLAKPPVVSSASNAAGCSSLSASIWGLTFVEVPRLLLGNCFGNIVRGWAQEQRWSTQLLNDQKKISDLTKIVATGECPISIFNACVQESGQRLLLSTARVSSPNTDLTKLDESVAFSRPQKKPFLDLVADVGLDMKVVTGS